MGSSRAILKTKTLTLYPISPSEAAADAPASPVPTTIISNFNLFAGLTRGTEDLYLVHFSANGPWVF